MQKGDKLMVVKTKNPNVTDYNMFKQEVRKRFGIDLDNDFCHNVIEEQQNALWKLAKKYKIKNFNEYLKN